MAWQKVAKHLQQTTSFDDMPTQTLAQAPVIHLTKIQHLGATFDQSINLRIPHITYRILTLDNTEVCGPKPNRVWLSSFHLIANTLF